MVEETRIVITKTTIALKLGIQENISRTVQGIENTSSGFGSGGKFALLNTASNLASNVKDAAGLLAGGAVGVVAPVSASFSVSSFNRSYITYGMNFVDFDKLEAEVTEDIAGDLELRAKDEAKLQARRIALTIYLFLSRTALKTKILTKLPVKKYFCIPKILFRTILMINASLQQQLHRQNSFLLFQCLHQAQILHSF